MEINFALEKNGGYVPSSLGGRLISVVSQRLSDKIFAIQFQCREF